MEVNDPLTAGNHSVFNIVLLDLTADHTHTRVIFSVYKHKWRKKKNMLNFWSLGEY